MPESLAARRRGVRSGPRRVPNPGVRRVGFAPARKGKQGGRWTGTRTYRFTTLGSIAGSANVGGMLLRSAAAIAAGTGTESDQLTAELYRYPNLDDGSRVAVLSNATALSFQEVLSEAGSGSVTLMADDPALASFGEDGNDVVLFKYRGQRVMAVAVDRKAETVIADGEDADERVEYTGNGLLGTLARAAVYPSNALGTTPIEEDQLFNWASPSFDASAWSYAVNAGDIVYLKNIAVFVLSGTITYESISTGLPSDDLTLLWGTAGSLVGAPLGDCYFIDDSLTIPSDGTYEVWFYCDDNGELYLDGQQVATISGINWLGVSSVTMKLSAGSHRISAHVRNEAGGLGAASFGASVWTIDSVFAQQVTGSLVWQVSPSRTRVSAYPPGPPGMSVGQVMRLVIEDAQARGVLSDVTLAFSDAADSDGVPWPVTADIATKTGTDLLTFFRELSATYVDVWMGPSGTELYAWNIDGRGSDRSAVVELREPTDASDPTSGNLTGYARSGEFAPVSVFLLRWSGGWLERTSAAAVSAYGRREAPLEIGAPVSSDEVYRVADQQFSYFADPRTEITAGILPTGTDDVPYIDFRVGDQVDTPDGPQRILGITAAIDDVGDARFVLTLGSIVFGWEERVYQSLSKVG